MTSKQNAQNGFIFTILGILAQVLLSNNSYAQVNYFPNGINFGFGPNQGISEEDRKAEALSLCSKEYEHEKLYKFGKDLAKGWSFYVRDTSKKNGKISGLPKDRSFMLFLSLGGLSAESSKEWKKTGGDMKEFEIVKSCWFGYYETASKRAWSSVHSGYIDYLTPKWKSFFLSLPER